MFLKVKKIKNRSYVSVVESVWNNGTSRHKTIASLGAFDESELPKIAELGRKLIALASSDANSEGPLTDDAEEIKRVYWGGPKVYRHLWDKFDLDAFVCGRKRRSRLQFDVSGCIFNMVLAQLLRPSSKLKAFLRQDSYQDIETVDLHHFYRALDFLSKQKEALEEHVFHLNRDLFNMSVDIVFFDVTTLYFESVRADGFKDFGYSKDCKFGEVQIVVALMVDQEGRPIGFDYFPGNTFEGKTLLEALRKLKNRFKINRLVIVADRGINNKLNLKEIRDAGYDYIVGSRLKALPKSMHEHFLDLNSYKTIVADDAGAKFMVKEVSHSNQISFIDDQTNKKMKQQLQERIICTWSRDRSVKDQADRNRMVEKAKSMLQVPSSLKNKRGARRYINADITDKPQLDCNAIAEDAKWDGIYGIQTSHDNLNYEQILDAYKTLWRIEESFRVIKSTLQARPIFHWTQSRIKGHLVMCFIAFLLERTLEVTLRKQNTPSSPEQIREDLLSMQASIIRQKDKVYFLRSTLEQRAESILQAVGIDPPKAFQLLTNTP